MARIFATRNDPTFGSIAMINLPSARASENFHIVLWLLKDLCWALAWKVAGVVLVVPTVAMAMWIAWSRRNEELERLPALAVVFWIVANGTWMAGEFFFSDRFRPFAVVAFAIGLLCIAWHYVLVLPRAHRADGQRDGQAARP